MNIDFSMALRALKNGDRVARAGWNGKGQWVAMQRPDAGSLMTLPYAYLRNTQGDLVPWLPSEGDLFAEDWQIMPRHSAASAPAHNLDPIDKIVRRVVSAALDQFERDHIAPRSAAALSAILCTAEHMIAAKGLFAPGDLPARITAEINRQEG